MEHGAVIVAGFGFRHGAPVSALAAALALAREAHGCGPDAVTLLATLEDKRDGLLPLAEALALPCSGLAHAMVDREVPITRSAASLSARGLGSVAEACALAAAGPGARLLGPRTISPDRQATCALAQGLVT